MTPPLGNSDPTGSRLQRSHEPPHGRSLTRYFDLSQQPLQILLFLAPFIVIYEYGTWMRQVATGSNGESTQVIGITAYERLNDFFTLFGIPSTVWFLPGIILVVILLVHQILLRKPWNMHLGVPVVMCIESLLLALPLLVLDQLIRRLLSPEGLPYAQLVSDSTWCGQIASAGNGGLESLTWQTRLVLSLGAGLYEELLFRMILMLMIHTIFVNIFGLSTHTGTILAVVLSSIAFTAYHHPLTSADTSGLAIHLIIFYFTSGVYFSLLYAVRGFGITAGTHAVYDIMAIVLLPLLRGM